MLRILLAYDNFQELTSVELMLKKIGFDVLGITSEFSLTEQLLSFNPQIVIAQGKSTKLSTTGVGKRLRESLRWEGQSVLIFYPNTKPQAADILKMRMDVGLEAPVEPTRMVQVVAQLAKLDANQLLDKLIKNIAHESTGKEGTSPSDSVSTRSSSDTVYVGGSELPSDAEVQQIISGGNFSPESAVLPSAPQQPLPATEQSQSPPEPPTPQVQPAVPIEDPLLQELENLLIGKPAPQEKPMLKDSKRAQVYNQILQNMPSLGVGGIPKTEAKVRLRDIIEPHSKEELRNQDDLRREFVKALFKRGT